jgi:hypothetical protein
VEEIIHVNLGFAVTVRNPTGEGEVAEFDRLAGNMKATATVDPDVGLESEDDAVVGSGESFSIEKVFKSVKNWAKRCAGSGVLPINPACILALSISVNVGVGVAADGGLIDFRFTKNMASKTVDYMSEGAVAIEGDEIFLQLQGSQTFGQIFGQSLAIAAGKTAVETSFGTDLEAKVAECPVIAKEYLNQLNPEEALVKFEKKISPPDPNACACNPYLAWVQEQPEEEQENMWTSVAEAREGCSSTAWASALDKDSPYYAYIAKFGALTKCNVPEPLNYQEDWRNMMTRDDLIERYLSKLQSCKKQKALVAGVKSHFADKEAQKLAPERTLSALKMLNRKKDGAGDLEPVLNKK